MGEKKINEEIQTLNLRNIDKPFLRWAGGKSWLMQHLTKVKKSNYNNYHEAFLGGGSAFFFFKPKNEIFLSDLNIELIDTYIALRDNLNEVITKMKSFTNSENFYYELRDTQFFNIVDKAARFIYLNQTSYNGIYRVNLKGNYNVPFGFRKKEFLNEENLIFTSNLLKGTNLFNGDFTAVLDNIKPGDLVFLDPPYSISHNINGFVRYNEKIFSLNDQIRLSTMINDIRERDAFYILTNAAHNTIKEIFEKGDKSLLFTRANLIGASSSMRGQTTEYVFTNTNL